MRELPKNKPRWKSGDKVWYLPMFANRWREGEVIERIREMFDEDDIEVWLIKGEEGTNYKMSSEEIFTEDELMVWRLQGGKLDRKSVKTGIRGV